VLLVCTLVVEISATRQLNSNTRFKAIKMSDAFEFLLEILDFVTFTVIRLTKYSIARK
jgi:hypothetical protein